MSEDVGAARGASRRWVRLCLCVGIACLLSVPRPARALPVFDPRLTFQHIQTPHFVIYFHQGEDLLAARLARIAEVTWTDMSSRFGWRLPARTHVVLADQTDLANGWATPLPYNTIMVTASWPSGAEFIGFTEDWLRLVFTHEFTHIAHLDRSGGWARPVRAVFGRVPLAFPNLFLPGWQIEGIATHYESAVTGRGRRFANDFRAIEREQARSGQKMPLDRVNGGLIGWPGGTAVYAYGLGFHDYLAREYGAERLVALAERTASRLPYFASTAFKPVFGQSLGRLWADYQASLRDTPSSGDASSVATPTRVTHEAFDVTGVRFLPRRCPGCVDEVAYSVRTPHEFPAIKVVEPTGRRPRTLTTRFLGTTLGATSDTIVFDQHELARNVGLYGDLYALDRRTGQVRRLTTERRLLDPDVSRDGRMIVAVRQQSGARDLVVASLDAHGVPGAVTTLVAEPGTQFSTPRWSPDGTTIAVERHRLGDTSQVVLIDRSSGATRIVASGATRAVTPAWRPDGRAVVVALDEPGGPFNIAEFTIDGDRVRQRRLTAMPGGALWPDVSSDGRTLAFVGYTRDGFDVFTQPYPADASGAAEVPAGAQDSGRDSPATTFAVPSTAVDAAFRPQTYTPWATLLPRSWSPILASDGDQTRAGFTTGGSDVLGYHGYAASVLWRATAPAAAVTPAAARPDWSAAYVYNRWPSQLFAMASRATSFLGGASSEDEQVLTLREQTFEVGAVMPIRRVLRTHRLLVSAQRSTNTLTRGSTEETSPRLALRTAWGYRSARLYGYSISPEHGLAAGVTGEIAGSRLAALDDATAVTADVRSYMPGVIRHHVVALRASGGASTGPRGLARTFQLGGSSPALDTIDFSRGAFSLLRGFAPGAFAGRRVAVVNGDYRFPIRWFERGLGTSPLFWRSLSGSVFADVGHVWNDTFRLDDAKLSVGVEVSTDIVVGYSWPLTIAAGVARGRDGSGRTPSVSTTYVRVGRAF